MTKTRAFVAFVLLLALPALLGASAQPKALSVTALSMTLHLADSGRPMADVQVSVYYLPFNPPVKTKLQAMAEATTNAAGKFTTTLDTSMVPQTGLADVGTGPDAFNAVVVAISPSRQVIDSPLVLQIGHTVTTGASAIAYPGTEKPELAAVTKPRTGHLADSADETQVGTSYRWIPVLALNSSSGMRASFDYTYDSSTSKQTVAGTAVSVDTGDEGFGPFSAGSSTVESTGRSLSRSWYVKGDYHKIIWVRYKWVEEQTEGCSRFQGCVTTDMWSLDHFQGSIGQYNPDQECVKRGHKNRHHVRVCLRKETVGVVSYKPPTFSASHCADDYCLTTLVRRSPNFIRSIVNTQMYDFQLNVAGFLGLDSQGAYGTITSVTWNWAKKGCTGNKSRVLWGYNHDPYMAPILQASCIKEPRQN